MPACTRRVSRRNPRSLIKNAFRAGHWAFETCPARDLHCWIKGIWDFPFAADLFRAIIVELRDRRKKYTRRAAGFLSSLFIFFCGMNERNEFVVRQVSEQCAQRIQNSRRQSNGVAGSTDLREPSIPDEADCPLSRSRLGERPR